jgi:ribosomal protein L12E/L44/L45/RPP1/RPP2
VPQAAIVPAAPKDAPSAAQGPVSRSAEMKKEKEKENGKDEPKP